MLLSVPDSSDYLRALERGKEERLRLQQMISLEGQREAFRSTAFGIVSSQGLSDVFVTVNGVLIEPSAYTIGEDGSRYFFQYVPSGQAFQANTTNPASFETSSFGAFSGK